MPNEAYAQKFPKAGKTDVAPIPNAKRSVTEVIVIATPECFIANPILSSKLRLKSKKSYFDNQIWDDFYDESKGFCIF